MAKFRVGDLVIAVNPTNPNHPSNVPAVVEFDYQIKRFPLSEGLGVECCWCYGVRLLFDGQPLVWADSQQLKRPGWNSAGAIHAGTARNKEVCEAYPG